MSSLTTVDYVIIIAYLLFTALIGLGMTKRASTSLEHYFLGGRNLPWWLLGVAGMTDWFDLTGTMIITSFLYMLGPRGLYVEFRGGAVLVLAFMLCYTGKWHRRSGCMTGAEWNTYRFGSGADAQLVRVIGALLGLISTVGMLAYLIKGCNLFLGMFVPWPAVNCTLVLIAITTLYTMCAGFYGRVVTDLVQGIIIMFACLIVSVMAWNMIPNARELATTAFRVTGNQQWTSSSLPFHVSMPKGYTDYSWLFMFALFYLVRNVLSGMGSGGDPRYFGAKNDRDCGLQSLLQGITVAFRWPMMIGFAVMGLYLVDTIYHKDMSRPDQAASIIHHYYPDIKEAAWHDLTHKIATEEANENPAMISELQRVLGKNWQQQMPLIGVHGTVNPERVLPAVLLEMIPTGLKGLILVAMLAALMSTLSGMINSAGALFVKDIWQNLVHPRASNRELIAMAWLASLGLVVGGVIMGIATESINRIWGWIIMSLSAGGLAPGLLRLYWWRFNAWGCLGGTVFGMVGSIFQYFLLPDMLEFNKVSPQMQHWLSTNMPGWALKLCHMPAEWQMFICFTLISFTGAIAFTLLTPKPQTKHLLHFYRTTRPFGWWGPIRKEFQEQSLLEMDRENRNDIMAVPITLVAQIALFLIPMQIVIKEYSSLGITLPIFIASGLGMYWFWWRRLSLGTTNILLKTPENYQAGISRERNQEGASDLVLMAKK